MKIWLLSYVTCLSLALLVPAQSAADTDCSNLTATNTEQCLRLNHMQVLGTHNSYKRWPLPELIDLLDEHRDGWARDISYEHKPLSEQLEGLNIRQFELDVFADPAGGLYADPAGARLVDDPAVAQNQTLLQQPGLKVLHSQDIDYRSTCVTLVLCLQEIRDWSLANPTHLPIMVMIEFKDGARPDWGPVEYVVPVIFDQALLLDADKEIWQVFDRDHVITPDDVRGDYVTLEQAVLENGWPTLSASRGKILFAMDNTGRHREEYLAGAPVLENRALFVSAEPGHPAAAFIKMNDALADHARIREYVALNYLVRTRSDVPTDEARTGDTTRQTLALESGAQFVSTDYVEPSPFGSGYQVVLPDSNGVARCNPVSAPSRCKPSHFDE
ncbi:MAG: phosphatidylinositol-specific phospholipase C1-like protein [Pseudohongiella sp.]|nr:phosphatidylinositol-specific phospholipase C1-like protein [Pseudohongiella sp.]